MANIPTIEFVRAQGKTVVCVMTFATTYDDGFVGVNYTNYDVGTGDLVARGYSKGWDGKGAGSMISATKNAKAAALRYIRRVIKKEQTNAC